VSMNVWWELVVLKLTALQFTFVDEMTRPREPPRGMTEQKVRAHTHTLLQSACHTVMKIHAHHLPLPAGASIQPA
jgi:hypothetical protein